VRFRAHHVAISVRDLAATASFYEALGFRLCLQWEARDRSLTIAHFAGSGGFFLEAFHWAANADRERLDMTMGNDLPVAGVKHLALAVDDVRAAREELAAKGFTDATPVQRGRTEMDFFFVRDPDGMWVEIAQDDRDLDPGRVVYLQES